MRFSIKSILDKISFEEFIGNLNTKVSIVSDLTVSTSSDETLFWCSDKNLNELRKFSSGTFICSATVKAQELNKDCNYIIVEDPRGAFQKVLLHFFYKDRQRPFISSSATIDENTVIGNNVFIGNNVVIEENCNIGDNTYIGHNSVIHHDTIIGKNVKIGANNTIGGLGFGYIKNSKGEYEFIPHIGNVILGDFVEIGNNTCIDRGVLNSTYIGRNTKIDNLVHIAHGVQIGENSILTANSMIAGSTTIGKNCWVAPSASVLNKISIGDDSIVGMGAVVFRSVETNQVVVGNPAKQLRKNS